MYTCIHRHIYTYMHIHLHICMDIYIYTYAYIYVHIHICIYICICTHVYIYLHNSCIRACATVQQLPCHGSYCELILSLARTSCRLSFPPALLPLRRACRPPDGPVRLRNPSKSTQAHDAVAAVVLHKHHLIIRVGAGLIQFVYVPHLRMAAGSHSRQKSIFAAIFAGFDNRRS